MANQEPTLAEPTRPESTRADRAWTRWASLVVIAVLATAGLLGFIIIPVVQGRAAGLDAYTAICRAIGILPGSPAQRTPISLAKAEPVSRVSWRPATLSDLFHGDKAEGAKVAEASGCVGCHAPDGTTADPTIPRMAAQSAFAIYKQLRDFKSGARVNEIMSAQVQNLDDKQIADLAAFYSTQVREDVDIGRAGYAGAETRDLVEQGDSTRALPSCNSCLGLHAGGPIETPTLTGQYQQYITAQLRAFAKGERHNDIYERMRNVAAKLTDHERELVARYYASPEMQR